MIMMGIQMKTMYKCETCGKMYNTKEAAMYCEKYMDVMKWLT